MTWFVIASIIGFWMHRLALLHPAVWYRTVLRASRATTKEHAAVWGSIAATLIVGVLVWMSFFNHGRLAARSLMETIESGASARLLLGILLGVVVSYAVPDKTPERVSTTATDKILVSSIAAAIALLALSAPHLDEWFSHLSSVKTSLIELQLSPISTSSPKVTPNQRNSFADEILLDVLRDYDKSVRRDIVYTKFQIRDLDNQEQDINDMGGDRFPFELRKIKDDREKLVRQQEQLGELYQLFHKIVSPAAGCFQDAVSNGLNVQSVRRRLGDVADMLTQLVFLEEREKNLLESLQKAPDAQKHIEVQLRVTTQQLQRHRLAVRVMAAEAPKRVLDFLTPDQRAKCEAIEVDTATRIRCHRYEGVPHFQEISDDLAARSAECDEIEEVKAEAAAPIPSYREYQDLPHLDIARAVLLSYVGNDALALRILREAAEKPFKEYDAPRFLGLLMFYRGDSVEKFADIFERMKTTAQERQQLISRVEDRCVPPCDRSKDFLQDKDELRNRARNAELHAMNNIAYAIADDLAQEVEAAEPFLPIAEDYAQILNDAMTSEKDLKNEFVRSNRDAFLDTAAFATIVTEARRKSSSIDKKKVRDATEVLEKVVRREEERINKLERRQFDQALKLEGRQRFGYEALNAYRAHLTSARALAQ